VDILKNIIFSDWTNGYTQEYNIFRLNYMDILKNIIFSDRTIVDIIKNIIFSDWTSGYTQEYVPTKQKTYQGKHAFSILWWGGGPLSDLKRESVFGFVSHNFRTGRMFNNFKITYIKKNIFS